MTLPLITYKSEDLQRQAARGYDLKWHFTRYKVSGIGLWWLYDGTAQNILAFYLDGRMPRDYSIANGTFTTTYRVMSQVLLPNGQWVMMRTKGADPKRYAQEGAVNQDLIAFDRNMGLKVGTLEPLLYRAATQPFRMDLRFPPMRAGAQWNQWTRLPYHDPKFDYRAHFAAVREEVPRNIMSDLMQFVVKQRHIAHRERNAFDWEKVYSDELYEIRRYLAAQADTHHCMDNVRVARVGNRQHFHHYQARKKRGCCGSHDEIVDLSSGKFHIGFNYGH